MKAPQRLGALLLAALLALPACYTPELVIERYYSCDDANPCLLSLDEGWDESSELAPEVCREDYIAGVTYNDGGVCVSCDAYRGVGCPCSELELCIDGSRCSALVGLCRNITDELPFPP